MPVFQASLQTPFTTAIGDVARSEDVSLDRVRSSTDRRRSLQATGGASAGINLDFTVTIPLERTDVERTRQDIVDFLRGNKTTSEGETLVEVLRAAAPSGLAQLVGVDVSSVEVEVTIQEEDMQVEEAVAPSVNGGGDAGGSGLIIIAVLVVLGATVLAGAAVYFLMCRRHGVTAKGDVAVENTPKDAVAV